MRKLLYLILFVSFVSFSQDYGNKEDAIKLCTAIQSNNFSSDTSADNALERILGVIGASKRFVLQPCDNINNAVATSFNGIRYILYDRDFMNTLDSGSNWGNLFILAHEVGHHINGHSLDILLYKSVEPKTLKQRRQQELEADEFAGFILAKLGGSLSSCNDVITKISNNSDDTYNTHPSRNKRIGAVRKGYYKVDQVDTAKIGKFTLDELPLSEFEVIKRFPNHVGGYHDKDGNRLFNGGKHILNHPDSDKIYTYELLNFAGEYFNSRCYYEYWRADENGNILFLEGVNILDGPGQVIASWSITNGAKYN